MGGSEGMYQNNFFLIVHKIYHDIFNFSEDAMSCFHYKLSCFC